MRVRELGLLFAYRILQSRKTDNPLGIITFFNSPYLFLFVLNLAVKFRDTTLYAR